MSYLLPTEYAAYGLSAETTDDWVNTASTLMEGFCHRPTLLASEYTERLRITAGSQTVRVSYLPLVTMNGADSPIVSLRARYGRPRRGEVLDGFREQVAWAFHVPGSWTTLDATTLDFDPSTGELTLAGNFLGLDYNEVEVTYSAGVLEATAALKVACAQIVKNAQATPGLNVKSSKIDRLQMEYFSGSLMDEQVRSLLRPYVSRKLG